VKIKDMASGDYWILETAAPPGYILSNTAAKVTVAEGKTVTVIIPNTAEQDYKTGNLQIAKVDALSDKGLAGAVFDVYKDSRLTKRVYKGLQTNSKGIVLIEGMDPGEYWLTETKAPSGYTKLKGSIKATVIKGQTAYITVKNMKTKEDDYKTGTDDYNLLLSGGIMLLVGIVFIRFYKQTAKQEL